MKTNFNNISLKQLKTEQSKLKTHFLDKWGNEILTLRFKVSQLCDWDDRDEMEFSKFNDENYNPLFTKDDGEPYYAIENLDIEELIEIFSLNLNNIPSIDWDVDVSGDIDIFWDLVEYHKKLIELDDSITINNRVDLKKGILELFDNDYSEESLVYDIRKILELYEER